MIGKALTSLKTSVFNWESSYFGGHERVVYDHPFIYVPKEFEFRYKNTSGSSSYVAEKVCSMFLHRVVKHHLMHTLVNFYLFGWGSCADLGWALAEGFRFSTVSPRPGDAFYQRVFAHMARWIAQFHGGALQQPLDPRLLLERWEVEEEAVAAGGAGRNSTI